MPHSKIEAYTPCPKDGGWIICFYTANNRGNYPGPGMYMHSEARNVFEFEEDAVAGAKILANREPDKTFFVARLSSILEIVAPVSVRKL